MQINNYIGIFLFIILSITSNLVKAQELSNVDNVAILDTFIVINGKTIDSDRILISRKELIEIDSIRVNKDGLIVSGFTITATTLGHSVELTTNKPFFSQEMKNEILNNRLNYKYIYIKNIHLQSKDSSIFQLSQRALKFIFKN